MGERRHMAQARSTKRCGAACERVQLSHTIKLSEGSSFSSGRQLVSPSGVLGAALGRPRVQPIWSDQRARGSRKRVWTRQTRRLEQLRVQPSVARCKSALSAAAPGWRAPRAAAASGRSLSGHGGNDPQGPPRLSTAAGQFGGSSGSQDQSPMRHAASGAPRRAARLGAHPGPRPCVHPRRLRQGPQDQLVLQPLPGAWAD